MKAQNANRADVTQRTMPLEMWIETNSRRTFGSRVYTMRVPMTALIAEARSEMIARTRKTITLAAYSTSAQRAKPRPIPW